MDKNAIKKFAVWARRELIARVSQRAALYEITEEQIGDPSAESVRGQILTSAEKNERRALIEKIKTKGYTEVMEEVAYTWFNRFCALRFMEVNGYLPSRVRVFTDDDNTFKPQILSEAINLELDGLDMERVYALKNENLTEELFKYLLIVQCNALNPILPGMFQKIEDYTELLFPDHLLRTGSVIEQMITLIPEADWRDQVQIIGWMYEGYNTERNEMVYDGSMSKARITKEFLPAATTIYTPDWPIRYMVENSLGHLWLEGHPSNELKAQWKYYLEEAAQERSVEQQLAEIRKEYAALNPEEIKCIDPCCGSGHILSYLFDVLVQIYESQGYMTRDAVKSIIENNLFGLDIDDRAAQLAYFSVMMKGRQYDSRFFKRSVQPHVYAIEESNHIDQFALAYFCNRDENLTKAMHTIIEELHDAKEYGSILTITPQDWDALYQRIDEIRNDSSMLKDQALSLLPLLQVAKTLSEKYDVIVTNPPYLGNSRFSSKLDTYVKSNYVDVKSDLSMVMYKHAISDMSAKNGFVAFITTSSWMFLSSFEKLRHYQKIASTIRSIVDFGTELFDGKVGHNPIVSWITSKGHLSKYILSAIRLVDYCYARRAEKEPEFFEQRNRYTIQQDNFSKIPGSPVAYWVSEKVLDTFQHSTFGDTVIPRHGLATSDNNRFLKLWHEVDINMTSTIQKCNFEKKWFPMNKGGAFRKWYGNLDWIINYENDGKEIKDFAIKLYKCSSRTIQNTQFYFKESITWSALTSGSLSFRWSNEGAIFGSGAHCAFNEDSDTLLYALAFMNGKVSDLYLHIMSPTLNTNVDDIRNTPFIIKKKEEVAKKVCGCIELSKQDWDSFETSWDFKRHPLICVTKTVSEAYAKWEVKCNDRFNQLKANEEELNRIFIDIYGLQDELTPEVEDKDVTVRKADLQREIKSLISYAVGCMFGRYSIDVEGLCYAGGAWDSSKYQTIVPDKDSILPICDDEYFEDDITAKFIDFVRIVYGTDTLEENLKFIADALGGKGQPREVIRNYFLNDFFKDHCKTYQKRPIYWLFDSGKKNGFKCLIYMHRYQPDTIARIRTDYVHEQQSRYRTVIADLENRIANAGTSERVKLNKQLKKLTDQAEETRIYEEKIHHLADQMIRIDLDDGVKVNYAKFADVLGKIK